MTTQTFNVPKMHCTSCAMTLEGIEDDLVGVQEVKANYRKQRIVVTYDESEVSEDQIMQAAGKVGYPAVPAEEGR